jgi:HlyD family secretion protein
MDVSLPTERPPAMPDVVVRGRARRRRWMLVLAAVLVAAALGGIAYYLLSVTSAVPAYRVADVTRGPVTASVIASGTVNPVINVQVGAQVTGQIKELDADFNSQVKSGQLLARIDPASFETQVAQAKADFESARANVPLQQAMADRALADLQGARATLETLKAQTEKAEVAATDAKRIADRARSLAQTGAGTIADRDTTQAIYDQAAAQVHTAQAQEIVQQANIASAEAAVAVARANVTMAEAQLGLKQAALDNAQVNLDHTYIRAPVDGTVVLRNVDVGQTVVASLQAPLLFTVAQDLRQMQVDASVDEADVGGVKVGQPVAFTVDAYPGRTFQGSVQQVRIAPQVVQNVVTYDVVISAPNADLALLPGLTANVRVTLEHRDHALLVPNAALRYRPAGAPGLPPGGSTGAAFVRGADGRLTSARLHLGISDGNVTEVVEGALQPGMSVVIGDMPTAASGGTLGSPGVASTPRL